MLGDELLRTYRRAISEDEVTVAEHLLAALEELVRSDPTCGPQLEQAYLLIGRVQLQRFAPTRHGH